MAEKKREPCSFTDSKGQVWNLQITVDAIGRLRRDLQFEVGDVLDNGMALLLKLAGDMPRLVSVLACILEDDLESKGVSSTHFGRSFTSADPVEDGFMALVEAISNFFQGHPAGDVLRGVIEKTKTVQSLTANKLRPRINAAIDSVDLEAVAESLMEQLTDAPASSG